MRKEEFLEKLEYLLQDIPDGDKEEALSYYQDYLAEAGPEAEEEAIEQFGSPERVAAMIRADLAGNLKDSGEFTDKGFEDGFKDPNFQVIERLNLPDEPEEEQEGQKTNHDGFRQAENGPYHEHYAENGPYERYTESRSRTVYTEPRKPWTNKVLKVILWGILLIMLSPVLLGAAGIGLGAVAAVLSLFLGVIATVFCLTAAAVILGVILAVFGVVIILVAQPIDGVFLMGLALISCGCGILGIVIMGLLFGAMAYVLPRLWKLCKNAVKSLTGRRKKAS